MTFMKAISGITLGESVIIGLCVATIVLLVKIMGCMKK